MLKAAFLEKFARFTDWPDQTFASDPDSPFIISVIGKSPFQGSLEEIYEKAQIKSRPVKIRYITEESQISGSHMLFICKSEKNSLGRIIESIKDQPVLIISDTKGFAEKGSHINLYITTSGTLHFEINPTAAKQAGLTIQIVLLEIAKIVRN
ncbi:MAG: YfiR family protein [Pseudomonadota bacterium]